ncbi:Uncharacterized protein TCAP_06926 [Tolypocladium capitatum]|uniref:Uncharacterized protein n=1 Tax=Tolypocladium capitatum TaxID=45235 RepID=A0A2K3Q6K1_9HYPO|nr:Uncharacterized protein TCAP_06926 [Tolypocladium capitatum]
MATTLVSGAAFGAAMMAAGFHNPAVVIEQFKFENWHMLQAFLAATAASGLICAVAEQVGYVKLQPRSSSPLGLFAKYDGNVIGGALLGVGTALSGSCPGTLYPQLAAGVRTGLYALAGASVGGILWAGVLGKAVKKQRESAGVRPEAGVVNDALGLSRATTLLLLEAACLAVITATTIYTPRNANTVLLGATGGLLVGLAQLVSILTRRSSIGISGAYEEIGHVFWWLVGGADPGARPASHQNLLFASGVAAGAWGLLRAVPALAAVPPVEVPPALAVAGGALMAVGSRMAGGCTCGHGISGISLLSASSVMTIATAFAAGGLVAPLVH